MSDNKSFVERTIVTACILFFTCGILLLFVSIFHDDDPSAAHTAQVTIAHFGGIAGDNAIVSTFLSIVIMLGSLTVLLKFSRVLELAGGGKAKESSVNRWKRPPTELGKRIADMMRKKDEGDK